VTTCGKLAPVGDGELLFGEAANGFGDIAAEYCYA